MDRSFNSGFWVSGWLRYAARDKTVVQSEVRVVFSTDEREIIRAHYAPRYRHLPPGLHKKLEVISQIADTELNVFCAVR